MTNQRVSPIRGGLSPQMGSTPKPVTSKLQTISTRGKVRRGPAKVKDPSHRIPSSITMRRNYGAM